MIKARVLCCHGHMSPLDTDAVTTVIKQTNIVMKTMISHVHI
jgi:hypothetical protein